MIIIVTTIIIMITATAPILLLLLLMIIVVIGIYVYIYIHIVYMMMMMMMMMMMVMMVMMMMMMMMMPTSMFNTISNGFWYGQSPAMRGQQMGMHLTKPWISMQQTWRFLSLESSIETPAVERWRIIILWESWQFFHVHVFAANTWSPAAFLSLWPVCFFVVVGRTRINQSPMTPQAWSHSWFLFGSMAFALSWYYHTSAYLERSQQRIPNLPDFNLTITDYQIILEPTSLYAEALNCEDQTGEPWTKKYQTWRSPSCPMFSKTPKLETLGGWTWLNSALRAQQMSKTYQDHPRPSQSIQDRGYQSTEGGATPLQLSITSVTSDTPKRPGDLPTSRSKWEIFRPWTTWCLRPDEEDGVACDMCWDV